MVNVPRQALGFVGDLHSSIVRGGVIAGLRLTLAAVTLERSPNSLSRSLYIHCLIGPLSSDLFWHLGSIFGRKIYPFFVFKFLSRGQGQTTQMQKGLTAGLPILCS